MSWIVERIELDSLHKAFMQLLLRSIRLFLIITFPLIK